MSELRKGHILTFTCCLVTIVLYYPCIVYFFLLRAIGMVWIIAAHIYFFSFGSIDNMQLAMNFAGLVVAQPMLNAAINVDTFFVLR